MTDGTSARVRCGPQGTEAAVSDGERYDDVSTRVIVAVAELRGVDPIGMEERLHDWVDPDALERLVETMEDGHVAFEMGDAYVRVESDGRVNVTEAGSGILDG